MMPFDQNERDHLSVVETIRQFWPAALLCCVATPLSTFMAHTLSAKKYVSEARVLVKLGEEFKTDSRDGGRSSTMFRLNEAINSEIEILGSRTLALDVVDHVDLDEAFPKLAEKELDPVTMRERAAVNLLERLVVIGVAESSVIRLALVDEVPQRARELLSFILGEFEHKHIATFADPVHHLQQNRLTDALAALQAADHEELAYRTEHGVHDTSEERGILLRRRDEAREQLRALALSAQLADNQALLTPLDEELKIQEEQRLLRAQQETLLVDYLPESDSVSAVQAAIDANGARLDEIRRGRNERINAEEGRWERALQSANDDLAALRGHEAQLRRLARTVRDAEARVNAARIWFESNRESQLRREQRETSLVVIDRPTLPLDPIGLGLMAKLALSLVGGAMLAVAALLLLAYRACPRSIDSESILAPEPVGA